MFSKIFVFGAGAVGSYYGALLSRKFDVTLIARRKHVQAIRKKGLVLKGKVNKRFKVKAVERVGKFPDKSLVLLCTKATANEKVAKQLKKSLGKDCVIVILQNGLGVEEIVGKKVGKKAKVFRAIVRSAADFIKPGLIKVSYVGETELGKSKIEGKLARMLQACGMQAVRTKKIKERIWRKAIWNSAVNPITALSGEKNCIVLKTRDLAREIVREGVKIANCEKGVNIKWLETFKYVIGGCKKTSKNRSSMLQDVLKKKRTEIDFINGAVVRKARKYGLKAEVNYGLWKAVKLLERTYT